MSNFFDLSESKKKALPLQELVNYAERLEINVHKVSEKSGKEIKKTKQELIDEMNLCMSKTKKSTRKSEKEIEGKTKVHNKKESENVPKVLIWMTDVKERFISDDETYKNNMLNKEYVEKNFKIKVKYGSILYYGDFYIWNGSEFVLLHSYKKDQVHYLSIGRNMTNKMVNAIGFFEKIET